LLESTLQFTNLTQIYADIQKFSDEMSEEFFSADCAFMMSCFVFTMLMTLPGLALFYGGLVRVQNVLSIAMQTFSIACLITVLWIVCGYSLCFSEGR